ncbi:D-alanyl-D-alanine carboxypeptidase family protein [Anaeroselena agilis]|uniref:serine-type D-Ala-D-Ala carboxypeptidase n=1 Tax=Anaeroselena agilis TaxID=3063788 RepID=A0ABU3NZ24_9FIRM|nr:D-alanyl-D-alanine carboxypeptidase family protein [Selenomonadales bacterium 4137-cl]
MKKTAFIALILFLFTTTATAWGAPAEPSITAKSAIVIEASTGRIIYAKAAADRRPPASTTKMMTLIVALEHGKLDDIVTASPKASATEGSTMWLAPGEQLKLGDLLYGMMLVSGNDATVAVAEHISGSLDKFARLMTEKAHAIGAINTNFTNSSGLPDPKHYSTAADLARIAAYGYKNPLFSKIVGTKHIVVPWPGKDHDRDLYNENKLLWQYEGGNGVKTGYTDEAGRCLVSGAKRKDIQLVAVVLDGDRMWEDSIKLLDYGFSRTQPVKMFGQGDIMKTVKVIDGKKEQVRLVAASALSVPALAGDREGFSTVIEAPDRIDAPVVAGQKLGTVKTFYRNTEIASVDLLATEQIERKSFFSLLWGSLWSFFTFIVRNLA